MMKTEGNNAGSTCTDSMDKAEVCPTGYIRTKWYNYIACFFAGMFLANAIPHFIQGILGYSYRTPFANPPGVGLSSPTVNVLWALFNIVAAYFLYGAGKVSKSKWWTILIFFIGFAIISIRFSIDK